MSRLFFLAAMICAAPAHAETSFFADIPDLPLPSGFAEAQTGPSFHAGDGRLVFAEAVGAGDGLAVRDFYYDTLPQLGWSQSAENGAVVFQRGRERLHLFLIREGEDRIRVRVQLAVQPASMNAD
ncbi:MAG: hypothetical protein H7124_09505 [Phycisphaerales bacterium]|nr:hypothetical protein [Hyphomonadaceae bacterium]